MRTDGSPRRTVALAALALATALVVLPGCFGDDDDAPEATPTPTPATVTATPTATPTPSPTPDPPTATATPTATTPPSGVGPLLPPDLTAQVIQLLLEAMGDPDSELFSGSLEALPPEVRALLDGLGADLLLGAVLADVGATVVVAVFPGSPAERAGLVDGDRVVSVDGAEVLGATEARAAVAAVEPGRSYALMVRRGGAELTLEVERETASEGNAWRAELLRSVTLVLLLQDAPGGPDLPPSLLGEFVEETPDGLRVFAVFPGSPAHTGGLRAGDVLVSIAGQPVATLADLEALMRSAPSPSEPIDVVLIRDGEELTLAIDLAAGGMFGGGAAAQ